MAECGKCGVKLGFLDSKHAMEDDGQDFFMCDECYQKWETEDTKKKLKIKEEKEKQRLKIREEEARDRKKRIEKIMSINNKWEYKIINLQTTGSGINATGNKIKEEEKEKLNELGLKGWELVSAVPMDSFAPRIGMGSTATEWVSCVFKRKIE